MHSPRVRRNLTNNGANTLTITPLWLPALALAVVLLAGAALAVLVQALWARAKNKALGAIDSHADEVRGRILAELARAEAAAQARVEASLALVRRDHAALIEKFTHDRQVWGRERAALHKRIDDLPPLILREYKKAVEKDREMAAEPARHPARPKPHLVSPEPEGAA